MKKLATFVLTCLALFGLASCNDDVEYGTPVTARISVSAPQDVVMRTQTGYGDTWSAMKLAYTIYASDGTVVIDTVTDFDASNEAHFDAELAKGRSYDIAFFAYAEGSPYTYNGATGIVTANYGVDKEYEGNNEALDAFYKYATYKIENNFSTTVVLTRAVAQINILTSAADYNACTKFYTPASSEIKVNAYSQFDLKHGLAVGTPTEVTFSGDITSELLNNANCPLTDYKWLAMNYIFTNEELVNIEATIYGEDDSDIVEVTAYNAPIQKNYRTNIYGDILTNNSAFTVVKSDEWLGGNDVEIVVEDFNTKAIFKISATQTVRASSGNLQYQASTDTYRFAPHQYDMISVDNKYISGTYTGWIDLFGWGTGGNPTNASEDDSDYPTFDDWGNYIDGNWRTLTKDEWNYLANNHTKGNAKVCGVNGLVLLPVNWVLPEGCSFNSAMNNWSDNIYDATAWEKMENAGALFLPAAGIRAGKSIDDNSYGHYWTSTGGTYSYAYYFEFNGWRAGIDDVSNRLFGQSVRLFKDVN